MALSSRAVGIVVSLMIALGSFVIGLGTLGVQTVQASSPPPVSTLNCYLPGSQQSCPPASSSSLTEGPVPGVVGYPEQFSAQVDKCVYTEPPVNGNNSIPLQTCTNPAAPAPSNGTNELIEWQPFEVVLEFYYPNQNPNSVCNYTTNTVSSRNFPYTSSSAASGATQPCIVLPLTATSPATNPPTYTMKVTHTYATAGNYTPSLVVIWSGKQPYTTYQLKAQTISYNCGNPATVYAGTPTATCPTANASYVTQQPQAWRAGYTNDQTQSFTQYYITNNSQQYTSQYVYPAGYYPLLGADQGGSVGCCSWSDGNQFLPWWSDEFNYCVNAGGGWQNEAGEADYGGGYIPDGRWYGCLYDDGDDVSMSTQPSAIWYPGPVVTTWYGGWAPYLTSSPTYPSVDQQHVASYTAYYHTSQLNYQWVIKYVPQWASYTYYVVNPQTYTTNPNSTGPQPYSGQVVDTCAQAGGCQYNYNVPPPYFQFYPQAPSSPLTQTSLHTVGSWSQDPIAKYDYTQWTYGVWGTYTDYNFSYSTAWQAYATGWNSVGFDQCADNQTVNPDRDGDADMGIWWVAYCNYAGNIGWESYAGYPSYTIATPQGYTNWYLYYNIATWGYWYTGWYWNYHTYLQSYTYPIYPLYLQGAWHDFPWTTTNVSYNQVNSNPLIVKQVEPNQG